MKRFFVLYGLFVMFYSKGVCQGDIDNQKKLFYRNENSYAFMLTSTGWGFNARYAKHIDAANKTVRDFDFAILKHPQEIRLSSIYSGAGNLVFGKKNIVFDLRYGQGTQKEIFRKFDIGGISIRRFLTYGISLALLKPVYYEVSYTDGIRYQKFNDSIFYNIYPVARASFFKGFSEIKPVPGVYLKSGVCFEFGKNDKVIQAVEAGGILEGFISKLEMMDNKSNYRFFLSLYISYRFGKVFDPNRPKEKKKKDYYY
jgi:hypothetical protein